MKAGTNLRRFVWLAGVSAVLAVSSSAAPRARYKPIDLGTLGGSYSSAIALNDGGQVVGISYTDGDTVSHAFSWTRSAGMIDLGTLGGSESYPYAVNANGQVVGGSHMPGDSEHHAFSWTESVGMTDLGTLGGTYSVATAVNSSGQVAGTSFLCLPSTTRGRLWGPAS
jgi:probable HAF family extracellular repeat protein